MKGGKMRIGVDAGCLGIKDERLKVGVYTVVKNLLFELSKMDKKNEYYLYSFYPIEKNLMKQLGKNMHNIIVSPTVGWLKIALPLRLLFDRPDVFLAANQAIPLHLPFSHYKTVGIFYDIAFEKYPQLYSYAASVAKHSMNSRYLAKHADSLIAISKSTKKDIERIYHVPSQKITVAYPGKENLKNVPAYRHERPYFLFVGAFKKTKNIPFLLQSFAQFLKTTNKNFNLLLVGGNKWMDPEIETSLSSFSQQIKERIQFTGFVDTHKLSSLFRGAYLFVSPSLYEGFGLPFLEAQSVGVPVIGSTKGSLEEIIGESGLLIDPKNSTHLVKAMDLLTENKNLYKKLSGLGRVNAQKYSWKLFAKEVQSALSNV